MSSQEPYDSTTQSKKPRKSCAGRKLMRWDPEADQLVLLAVDKACSDNGIIIPWDAVAKYVRDGVTGEAIKQHLAKMRVGRINAGQKVPGNIEKGARRKAVAPNEGRESMNTDQEEHDQEDPECSEPSKKSKVSNAPKTMGLLYIKPGKKHSDEGLQKRKRTAEDNKDDTVMRETSSMKSTATEAVPYRPRKRVMKKKEVPNPSGEDPTEAILKRYRAQNQFRVVLVNKAESVEKLTQEPSIQEVATEKTVELAKERQDDSDIPKHKITITAKNGLHTSVDRDVSPVEQCHAPTPSNQNFPVSGSKTYNSPVAFGSRDNSAQSLYQMAQTLDKVVNVEEVDVGSSTKLGGNEQTHDFSTVPSVLNVTPEQHYPFTFNDYTSSSLPSGNTVSTVAEDFNELGKSPWHLSDIPHPTFGSTINKVAVSSIPHVTPYSDFTPSSWQQAAAPCYSYEQCVPSLGGPVQQPDWEFGYQSMTDTAFSLTDNAVTGLSPCDQANNLASSFLRRHSMDNFVNDHSQSEINPRSFSCIPSFDYPGFAPTNSVPSFQNDPTLYNSIGQPTPGSIQSGMLPFGRDVPNGFALSNDTDLQEMSAIANKRFF